MEKRIYKERAHSTISALFTIDRFVLTDLHLLFHSDIVQLMASILLCFSLFRSRWRRSNELCLARSLKKELNYQIRGATATVTTVHLATVSPRAVRPYLSPRCQPGVTRMRCSNAFTHGCADPRLPFLCAGTNGFD